MKKIFLIVFLLFGCTSKNTCTFQENIIPFKDVFNQHEDLYYVFFFLDGCLACRNTIRYLRLKCEEIKENIYYVNFLDYQQNNERENNIGVDKIEDIYLTAVPYLIRIENHQIVDEILGQREITHNGDFFDK